MRGAKFFFPAGAFAEVRPLQPIKVLFLTSLRDSIYEDLNGQYLSINGSLQYMEGVVEHTIKETKLFGELYNLVNVVGVIYDDTPDDIAKAQAKCKFTVKHLLCPHNILPPEKMFSIPSVFRKLRVDNFDGRKRAKLEFEQAVLVKARQLRADVIISDSYMAKIDYLHTELGMHGRLLNIHPGPSMLGMEYCFRGKDPIGDAIFFAQTNEGYAKTGATLHFVNGEIDDGNAVAYICETPVHGSDSESELMIRNYEMAKLPLFIQGLKHYIFHIYPHL